MSNKVQVKGTLPLIAEFLNTTESRIYEIFNLNENQNQSCGKEKKGGKSDESTNKSKSVSTSKDSI